MGSKEKLLLADDNPVNLDVLRAALEPEGYEILAVPNGETAIRIAAKAQPALILLDIMMPGITGLETCRLLKASLETSAIPVIFLTAKQEMHTVAEAFRAGGVDYVTKPFQTEEVLIRIDTHLKTQRLTRELTERNEALQTRTAELLAANERLRAEIGLRQQAEQARDAADEKLSQIVLREAGRWTLDGFVGKSKATARLLQEIRKLHQFGATGVLISGESGTGKELIARGIHHDGPRSKGPFVAVNCAAIPADLLESTFFGHLKGAFTGALSDRKGHFEEADEGTLFLDEIGDMPAGLQAKLLRVLEDGLVTPVGSSASRKVDVRVICATNADLEAKLASGAFRQDLYFRLARFTISTMPLRERKEDIPLLAEHFLRNFAMEMGLRAPDLDPSVLEMLSAYDFPGNVRELKNILERCLIESGGRRVEAKHLHLPGRLMASARRKQRIAAENGQADALPLNVEAAEEELIQRALRLTNGNIAEAARLLGVNRTRIYRKLAGARSDVK